MARVFFPGHNYQINLSEGQDGTEYYHQMLAFLRQSRISYALSHAPLICEPYLIDFWTNARYIKRAGGEIIRTKVANQEIEFTADNLRVILDLGTISQEGGAEGLTVFDRSIITGGLRRMGFLGDMTKSTLFKKGFYGRWRYLAHVLLVGLSNKKSGWDTLNQEAQAQMVGLVYNKPYSFSRFFFNEMRKQISARGTTRFLMYPRFVMMIISARLPNLPNIEPVRRVTTLIKRSYNEFISRNANDPNAQDVELFGAILNINFATPSDEVIASFDDLPATLPQQQLSAQEVIAQQLNVMLDEQAVNPTLAQAVIHEILQEHAPTIDPLADIEAFHEDADQADKGKGAVDEEEQSGKTDKMSCSDSDSESGDSDGDDDSSEEVRVISVGSKVVAKGDSSTGQKRKENVDLDYVPEVEESPEERQSKRAKVIVEKLTSTSTTPFVPTEMPVPQRMKDSVPRPTPTMIANPFQFQLNDLNNKMKIMETRMGGELESLKKKHAKELNDQKVQHLRDVNLLNMRIDRLNADFERERARNSEAIGKIVSTMADELVSNVSRSDMEDLVETYLKKKGLIPDLGCKDDELLKKKNNDQNDDPDAAEGSDTAGHHYGDMSKALVVFQGELSKTAESTGDGQKEADSAAETGFNTESSNNTSSSNSSDHEGLIREIQIKFSHDKMLAENVYADLMEIKFQEEAVLELSKEKKEQVLTDSLSSSDSDYVPEKDK